MRRVATVLALAYRSRRYVAFLPVIGTRARIPSARAQAAARSRRVKVPISSRIPRVRVVAVNVVMAVVAPVGPHSVAFIEIVVLAFFRMVRRVAPLDARPGRFPSRGR
jgi:hypothetical protein